MIDIKYLQQVWRMAFFILVFGLTSCTSRTGTPPMVQLPNGTVIAMPDQKNNELVRIVAPLGWNTFKITDPVALAIRNLSDDNIIFQPDYSMMLFIKQSETWIPVRNTAIYTDTNQIILEPESSNDTPNEKEIFFNPDLNENEGRKVLLRVVIRGTIVKQGKEDEIIVYADVSLEK
jgi:hypothetical protein